MNTNTIIGNKFRLSADVIVNDFISETYKKFTLYPNPAKEYITLEYRMEPAVNNHVIEIVSLAGVHVETFRLHGTQGVKIIDLRRWKQGTYIIRLSNNGKTLQNEKFVKY